MSEKEKILEVKIEELKRNIKTQEEELLAMKKRLENLVSELSCIKSKKKENEWSL